MWRDPTTDIERKTPETTETGDSYATVPEISEKTERFFNSLLEQKKSKELNINVMAGPSDKIIDTVMKDGTPKPTELKLSPPKAFTGKRDEFDRFWQDVTLYLELNDEVYNTDKRKIAYTLSFMNEGDAESWKGQFLSNAKKPAGLDLGSWSQFETNLTAAFKPYDAPGDALEKITALKMGNNSIEDHVAKYKILLSKAGVNEDSPSAIDYFRKSLNIPLQKNLLNLPTPPKDLKEWYEWATHLDNNYRKMQHIFNRTPRDNMKNEPKKHWQFQRKERDPNAMDIDALTIKKRTEMMKKGQCFGCGESGHLNRDCPKKKKTFTPTAPKKMSGKELYTHIRSFTATMEEKDMDEFYQEAEKGVF